MQTPRAPSGPPVYEVPLNPVDAATAALVDYEAERRRAEQEEAKLVKGYMVGGGNSGWIDKAKKTPGGEGVINSGFRFSTTPQNAAGIPSRSSSVASFNSSARAQRTQDFLNRGCNNGAAYRTKPPRESRRCRLRKLQCMLRRTAAEGFRLLCGEKKHQLTGQAEAETRSFFSGATAAAAAAASSKDCNTDALRAPVTNNTSIDGSAGRAVSGGVSVEHAVGQDTSTHLLRSLAQGCQILAQELDQHIRSSGLQPFLFGKTFVSMWMKRRAGVPWRRTATSMKQKKRRKKRQYEFAKPPTGKLHFAHAVVGGKTSRFACDASSGEADEPKHAHLLLKEELRRKVYEQMEARAATVRTQQVSEEASDMWVHTTGGGTVTQLRVFKKGFDSEPPSSHGSYQTASEYESSDSVPTEAYVSPSSSARSSSRGSNSSKLSGERASEEEFLSDVTPDESAAPLGRYGSTTTFETLCGKENTASDASSEQKRSKHTSASRNVNELREGRVKEAKFQWLAGYSAEEQEREATVMRQQQKSHVALAINSGKRQSLQQHVEAVGRFHQLEGKYLVHSTLPVHRRGQRKGEGGSVESVDLEALRAQSFTSERGTLDSLPESDLCEPLPSSHQDRQNPLVVSSISTLKRRILRNRDNCVSRASGSCESITALAESSVPATKSAPADYIEMLSKTSEERVAALTEATSSAEGRGAEPQVACMDNETKTCQYMAEGGSWTGVSVRMKEAYASCLQKARRSFLSGNFRSATASVVASGRTENPPGALAAALKGPAAPHAGSLHAPRDPKAPCFATSRSKDSKSGSHVTCTAPTPRMLSAFVLFFSGNFVA